MDGKDERIIWDVHTMSTITRDKQRGYGPEQASARQIRRMPWLHKHSKSERAIRTVCCRKTAQARTRRLLLSDNRRRQQALPAR